MFYADVFMRITSLVINTQPPKTAHNHPNQSKPSTTPKKQTKLAKPPKISKQRLTAKTKSPTTNLKQLQPLKSNPNYPNHLKPATTTQSQPKPPTTNQNQRKPVQTNSNHTKPAKSSTTIHNQPQLFQIIQNHHQPAKSLPKLHTTTQNFAQSLSQLKDTINPLSNAAKPV